MESATRALVTGACGFVGRAILRALREQHPEWRIWAFDLQSLSTDSSLQKEVEFVKADVTDRNETGKLFAVLRPDIVIHTAGYVPALNERYHRRLEKKCRHVNVEGTRNVLDAARAVGCRAFVYTSSCTAVVDDWRGSYPNINESWPTSAHSTIYGESKAVAEELVLAANDKGMPTCILRPAVIFGEGDTQLVPPNHACIAKGETPFVVGKGHNLWDTVYVGNVADAHVLGVESLLASKSAAGQVFFIQNNEPITFREFQLAVWRNFGHHPTFEITIPENLAWALGFLAECFSWAVGTATTLSRGSVLDACATRYASGEKARRILGYVPRVGLEEGLLRSCKEYSRRLKRS